MTSLANFEEKIVDRPSDVILESINRLYDAKLSGAIREEELSKIIVLEGDLFANKIKQGKVSNNEIEQTEAFLTGFIGENKDKYFSLKHKDLDRASKMFLEGDFFALEDQRKRSISASPIFEETDYKQGFRKIM